MGESGSGEGAVDATTLPWGSTLLGVCSEALWYPLEQRLKVNLGALTSPSLVTVRAGDYRTMDVHVAGSPRHDGVTAPLLTLQVSPQCESINVVVEGGTQVRVRIQTGRLASVAVSSSSMVEARCDLELKSARRLTTNNVVISVAPIGKSLSDQVQALRCTNTAIRLAHASVVSMHVNGACKLEFTNVRLGELSCERGTALFITSDHRITRLVFRGPRHRPRDAPDLVLHSTSRVHFVKIEGPSLVVVGRAADLALGPGVADLAVKGHGKVHVFESAENLQFGAGVTLSCAPHSQLIAVSGSVRLGDVRDSTLVSQAYGKWGSPALTESLEVVEVLEPVNVQGASLSGVRFGRDSRGLQAMSAMLVHAHHVSPSPDAGVKPPSFRRRSEAGATGERRVLRDAVFAETLARLAEAKGAASAIRARLAWDSYRLRNLAAPSWGERTLLSGYRLLGYGELPWVAFATYAVLSGLLATLELRAGGPDLSIDGVERFVESTLFWLAAPLHLFNLASGELRQAFPEPAQTLAKLVVTVPFGTGVFALRKYVKAPT